ncbi:MAG: Methionyl-tRNA formyltransferase, partial [Verrucomicrobiota bacterium]
MRVVFMGSDPIALPMLEALVADTEGGELCLVGVFTQPDRPRGRGHRVTANAIKSWAVDKGLPVFQPERCDAEACLRLEEMRADIVLVMAFGQLLPRGMLDLVPGRFFNFHASLLPRLRGASPIQTAIALGLERTGVSLMRIIPKMDAGPVADAEEVSLGEGTTVADLSGMLGAACVPLVRRVLPKFRTGSLDFEEQDPAKVSYCRLIKKTDANLDFRESASELERRIRALNPWPGPRVPYGGEEIRIQAARVLESDSGAVPGTILDSGSGQWVIACGRGALAIEQAQRAGGKVLPIADFLRGYAIQSGVVLESRLMEPL